MNYQSVLSEVQTWPIEERIRLVQDLSDRLVDEGHEAELTEELKAEARLSDCGTGPQPGSRYPLGSG